MGFPSPALHAGTPSVCTWGWQVGVPTPQGWHGAAAGSHRCQSPGQGQGPGHAGDAWQNTAPFHYGQEPP